MAVRHASGRLELRETDELRVKAARAADPSRLCQSLTHDGGHAIDWEESRRTFRVRTVASDRVVHAVQVGAHLSGTPRLTMSRDLRHAVTRGENRPLVWKLAR